MVMLLSCAIGTYAEQALPEQRDPSTLVVGHTTMMNGNFFSDIWGNNSADIDVRSLIHEYPLVAWTSNGEYQVNNTVVRALETTTDGNGDKTFTVTLHDDLYYSDGSPIGAKDYVFNILLMSSAQIRELSGVSAARVFLDGFEEYQSEEVPFLSGIRLLGDLRFSVRVKAENLPYYFELSYINTYPLPPVVLAPGADIADDGEGACSPPTSCAVRCWIRRPAIYPTRRSPPAPTGWSGMTTRRIRPSLRSTPTTRATTKNRCPLSPGCCSARSRMRTSSQSWPMAPSTSSTR